MTQELKACPFCGGEAEIDTMRGYSHYPPDRILFKTGREVAIYCLSCGAEMAFDPAENGESREHVERWLSETWNTRAPDSVIAELEKAVLSVVDATRAYLPPDGISEQECINRILEATDNPAINPIIAKLEASK